MAEEDERLNKLAVEELLRETRRAAIRANEVGSSGWRKCPLPSTNKRFIRNTLLSTLSSAKRPKIVQDSPKEKRIKIEEEKRQSKTLEKREKCTKSKEEHKKPQDKSKSSSKQTENKSLKNR